MTDINKIGNNRQYEKMKATLEELTPNEHSFEKRVYPPDEVSNDIYLAYVYKNSPEYKENNEDTESKILEKTFIDVAERDDWFSDNRTYGDIPGYRGLIIFPTSEIDDMFNHIDAIGMIKNKATGNEITPFAIDLTYNTDEQKMNGKFRWRHVYGKKGFVPNNCSEFGEWYSDTDDNGKEILRARFLPISERYGLKIPGFASAKYFEDMNDGWNPMYEKGRIKIMPRFIIGYSAEIANALANGLPTVADHEKYGEEYCKKQKSEYERAERRAKWCTLMECAEQASDIRYMLEHMDNEETKWMRPEELEQAKERIMAMDNYFRNAINVANQEAKNKITEINAINYAEKDTVCQSILRHSEDTYIKKSWQNRSHDNN